MLLEDGTEVKLQVGIPHALALARPSNIQQGSAHRLGHYALHANTRHSSPQMLVYLCLQRNALSVLEMGPQEPVEDGGSSSDTEATRERKLGETHSNADLVVHPVSCCPGAFSPGVTRPPHQRPDQPCATDRNKAGQPPPPPATTAGAVRYDFDNTRILTRLITVPRVAAY